MKHSVIISMIALVAIQFVSANGNTISIIQNQTSFNPPVQGGILQFSDKYVQRLENSAQNSEPIFLSEYSGLPLKALQLKIVINNTNGKFLFKSLTRGSSIPESSFLFDYEFHPGTKDKNGSSIDFVNAVILGYGDKTIPPGSMHHLISINYDAANIECDSLSIMLSLCEVAGATSVPIQDANISSGKEEIICLRKSSPKSDTKIDLHQNFPNPFNPTTTIKYSIPANDIDIIHNVVLKVYDVLGNEISTLADEPKTAGNYEVEFDASNLSSGIYFYSINYGNTIVSQKMILMK